MGDRATIKIVHHTSPTPIHLYTHWAGAQVTDILAVGLDKARKAGRLSDESYATRIIFDTLTGCDGGETGYGIAIGDDGEPGDLNHLSPTVLWAKWGTEPIVIYEDNYYTVDTYIKEFSA